jgi:hypothetical protein
MSIKLWNWGMLTSAFFDLAVPSLFACTSSRRSEEERLSSAGVTSAVTNESEEALEGVGTGQVVLGGPEPIGVEKAPGVVERDGQSELRVHLAVGVGRNGGRGMSLELAFGVKQKKPAGLVGREYIYIYTYM